MSFKHIVSGLVAVAMFSSTAVAQVEFTEASFAEAQKLAAKEKKLIMVDYYTDWCKWCKVLDVKTYLDKEVGKIANDKFISIKINAEKGEGIALAKKNGVEGFPTIVFYDAKGTEVDRVVGYQDATKFVRSIRTASQGGIKAVIARLDNVEAKNAGMWLQAAAYYTENGEMPKAINAYDKVIALDASNALKMKEEAIYGRAFLMDSAAQLPALKEALAQYPDREEARQATEILLMDELQSAQYDAALERAQKWTEKKPDDFQFANMFAWELATRNVMLDQAENFANKSLYARNTTAIDRAAALDTKAEVMFRDKRADMAVVFSKQAIALLHPEKDKRMYKELATQLAKFEEAAAAMPARQNK